MSYNGTFITTVIGQLHLGVIKFILKPEDVSSAFPLQGAADRNVLKSQEETKEPRYTQSSFISL